MTVPTREMALDHLRQAEELNPGEWIQHSMCAAEAAQAIACQHPRLDPGRAYALACLHDIGRRVGKTGMRHIVDGYEYLGAQGLADAARVCLTHSFPVKDLDTVAGIWDLTPPEFEFVQSFLAQIEYDDYDRLVQLCDALALPSGFCLIEKRLIDVALRHGITSQTVQRWRATLEIQKAFEKDMGCSIYNVLPGVMQNTFGVDSFLSWTPLLSSQRLQRRDRLAGAG